MLRPTAVPSEHLPSEMTSYIERSDSPDNTSSSYVSLEHHQSDSSTSGNLASPHHPQVASIAMTNGNGNIVNNNTSNNNISTLLLNNNNNNNNTTINSNNHTIINSNGNHHHHHNEYQEDVNVKLTDNFAYHQNSAPIVQATNVVTYQQASSYDTLLTPLSTVPYQEINEQPMYMISDGTEIDQSRLASVLNKDGDYGDGTITYVVNFVDY